jgi:hypothetical protein
VDPRTRLRQKKTEKGRERGITVRAGCVLPRKEEMKRTKGRALKLSERAYTKPQPLAADRREGGRQRLKEDRRARKGHYLT